jgi:3-phosphoshikimate 1-carboxyvinyltransferase
MKVEVGESVELTGEIEVPNGDVSAAAAWLVAATTAHHDANVRLLGVNMDPSRTGIIDALTKMGARLEIQKRRQENGHEVADLWVRSSWLRGADIDSDIVARMMDDLPLFTLAAAVGDGETTIHDLDAIRAKHPEMVKSLARMLGTMDVYADVVDGNLVIRGEEHYHGGDYDSEGDYRIGLALGVAGLIAAENVVVAKAECVQERYPGFWDALKHYTGAEVVYH